MNILILGSEGFIGKHLVKYYADKKVNIVGADILQEKSQNYKYHKISRLSPDFDDLVSSCDFQICINAAGNGNVPYSMNSPVADFEANSLDVIKFLDCIRRYAPSCKYLHISSAAVYGNPNQYPTSEESTLSPLSPYGWHKWISELICKEYHTVYGIKTAIVRPFSVYGPGLRKQLFWDVYNKYLDDAQQIEMWGTGEETRDFIYIDDLVNAIDIILEKSDMEGCIFNLASGEEITIRKATEMLIANLSPKTSIIFNNKVRSGDPTNWKADIEAIRHLGFKAEICISDGIGKLAAWLESQN